MDQISREDIKRWVSDPVGEAFFSELSAMYDGVDGIESVISGAKTIEQCGLAALAAGNYLRALTDVMELPNRLAAEVSR